MELSNALFTATCSWLVHLASSSVPHNQSQEVQQMNIIKTLPLTVEPNRQLSYIPEFVLANIVDFVQFLNQFNEKFIQVNFIHMYLKNRRIFLILFFFDLHQSMEPSSLKSYIDVILVFMGDAKRLHNPHIRATLAETLEVILPKKNVNNGASLNK